MLKNIYNTFIIYLFATYTLELERGVLPLRVTINGICRRFDSYIFNIYIIKLNI